MRCALALPFVLALSGCAPDDAASHSSSATIAATSADASADATVTVGDTGPGDPVCSPWMNVGLGWERDGDDALPSAGGVARVAAGADGDVVVAATDATEDDEDVAVVQLDGAGDEVWSLRYEGMAGLTDEPLDIAVASDGSIYVAVREQTLELISEGFGSRYEYTLVVLAIEPWGEPRWRYEHAVPAPYSDTARAAGLAVTDDGHVIVVDGDATSGDIAPPRLLELDRFGNEVTSVDLEIALSETQSIDVDVSATGAVYVVAARYGGSWIGRLQRDGATEWADDDDPGNVIATSIAAGLDDEAYVLARIGDDEAGDSGFELRRYTAGGSVEWTYAFEWPSGAGSPAAVVIDCDGAPIVAGEIQDAPDRYGWVGRISPYGELSWSRTLTSGRAIAPRTVALAENSVLVLGGLEGNDELGPWVARLDRP